MAQRAFVATVPPEYVIPGTVFTTVTMDRNWRTAAHRDTGDYQLGFGVLAVLEGGHFTGGELIFPKYGTAVNLRTGGVLLAGEMAETSYVIKQLAESGVEIFEYVHGKSLTPKTPTDKLLSSVQGFADEDHAVKTSERVKESHTDKVQKGHVVGGRVFGYRNADVFIGTDVHDRPMRSHVVREVVPKEAAVIRRIFKLYVSGLGAKAIAKRLNTEDVPPPTPFVRVDPMKVLPERAWSPMTIRAMLCRELYRGVVVWNRSRKRNDQRKVNQRPRPADEWMRLPVNEDLRIVSDDLWAQRNRVGRTRPVRPCDSPMGGCPDGHRRLRRRICSRAWPPARNAVADSSSRPRRGGTDACIGATATSTRAPARTGCTSRRRK